MPLALLVLWLTAELLPLDLSLDFRSFKANQIVLFDTGQFVFHAAGALIAGRALAAVIGEARSLRWLPILAGLVAIGSVLLVTRAPDASTLSGLAMGCVGWWRLARWHEPRRGTALMLILLFSYAVVALSPFGIRDTPEPFNLVPFALLREPLMANIRPLAADMCLFAGILGLIKMNRSSPVPGSIALAILVTLFGAMQMFIAGRTPDITDPLVVLIVGQLLLLAPPPSSASRSRSRRGVRTARGPDTSAQGKEARETKPRTVNSFRVSWVAILGYVVLIVYASLYPMIDWRMPKDPVWSFLAAPLPKSFSRADVVSNIVAYMPLGLLLAWRFRHRLGPLSTILAACLIGTFLSLFVESVQMYLPSRTSSPVDLLTNAIGTVIGALVGELFRDGAGLAGRLYSLRNAWFLPGRVTGLGLGAIVMWVLSQLSPFVPSLDFGTIREGISALRHTLQDMSLFRPYEAAAYVLNILGLGLLAKSLIRPGRLLVLPFASVVTCVLLLKPFIVSRQLSLEALCGLAFGIPALLLLGNMAHRARNLASAIFLLAGFAAAELSPGTGALSPFNWIPFAGEIENNLNGFANILAVVWPFLAVSCLANLALPDSRRFEAIVAGALLTTMFAFLLEWNQQYLPGRHADVTTVLLAFGGWILPWRWQYDRDHR